MNQNINQELLSAYLDGEATSAERAQVESWLANSPGAREVLDDLRQVSGMLRELPRETAPPDFQRRVLQIAERKRLPGLNPCRGRSSPRVPAAAGGWERSRWRRRRRWCW
jgi:anti-sigma factor RsiW